MIVYAFVIVALKKGLDLRESLKFLGIPSHKLCRFEKDWEDYLSYSPSSDGDIEWIQDLTQLYDLFIIYICIAAADRESIEYYGHSDGEHSIIRHILYDTVVRTPYRLNGDDFILLVSEEEHERVKLEYRRSIIPFVSQLTGKEYPELKRKIVYEDNLLKGVENKELLILNGSIGSVIDIEIEKKTYNILSLRDVNLNVEETHEKIKLNSLKLLVDPEIYSEIELALKRRIPLKGILKDDDVWGFLASNIKIMRDHQGSANI